MASMGASGVGQMGQRVTETYGYGGIAVPDDHHLKDIPTTTIPAYYLLTAVVAAAIPIALVVLHAVLRRREAVE